MKNYITNIREALKKEAVLCIAAAAAALTMFFVPPSAKYIGYIDFRVLSLLFCLMAVVAGFQKTGLFIFLSEKLLKKVSDSRSLSYVLIMLCFFTSMWITNDVALITFVPFAIMILTVAGKSKLLIPVVVLQTIAANLGSMLTPVGNPQNLYLYSTYDIPVKEFLMITLPVTALSFVLLSLATLLIKKESLEVSLEYTSGINVLNPEVQVQDTASNKSLFNKISDKKNSLLIVFYGILFLICLGCVIRLVDYRVTLIIVFLGIMLFDRTILNKVDYMLLLTFVCFFLFVGNIGSIPAVKDFLGGLLKGRELPVAILASQGISNVPAAVLLSAFTNNYRALILGTDIGGLGTLVASLASLISYKFYSRMEGAKPGKYLRVFTLLNVLFLGILCLVYLI